MSEHNWLTARPIAHRGLHDLNKKCWENSPTAFARAVEQGFAIECDVQITGDDKIVVFHDFALERLTGIQGFTRDRTADEMRKLNIGGTEDQVIGIPELLEIVDGRVPLIVEMKGNPGKDDLMVDQIAADIADYSGQIAVMAFGHHLVRQFAEKLPNVPTGLVAEHTKPRDLEAHFSMLAHKVEFVSFDVDDLPNPFVETVHDRLGLPVITWTVRTKEQLDRTYRYADQPTFEGMDPREHI